MLGFAAAFGRGYHCMLLINTIKSNVGTDAHIPVLHLNTIPSRPLNLPLLSLFFFLAMERSRRSCCLPGQVCGSATPAVGARRRCLAPSLVTFISPWLRCWSCSGWQAAAAGSRKAAAVTSRCLMGFPIERCCNLSVVGAAVLSGQKPERETGDAEINLWST